MKVYTQTPVVIAAYHKRTNLIKYLIEVGALSREPEAKYDAMTIALADRCTSMLACLLEAGVTFASNIQLGKVVEIAVELGNAKLAGLLLEAGANPDAEERCVGYRKEMTKEEADAVPTFYGTLFQWACAYNDEDTVRAFLDHGVSFRKPLKSWANWRYNTPLYVAWSCRHFGVVRAILDYYKDEHLAQFTCSLVQNAYAGLSKHCAEFEAIRTRSSWLLKKCLAQLHEMSEKDKLPEESGTGYVRIIKRLTEMSAWLPPDSPWHFSDRLVLWLGFASLDNFLAACAL
jgi:ankyrin repeat protein